MDKKLMRADLALLKKYMEELEVSLGEAYSTRDDTEQLSQEDYNNFMVKLSKSVGILSGISQESALLISDLQKIGQYSMSAMKETDDVLTHSHD